MQNSRIFRRSLQGSAAIIAMLGTFTAAQAYETQFGDVSITFDTTVSMGASMLVQERNTQFLPEANGGPVDPRADLTLGAVVFGTRTTPVGFGGAPCATASFLSGGPATCGGSNVYTANGYNFDGSINTDDGRLNFDRGDLIGANVKASHDMIVSWQNYRVFARAVGFYDVIMNDNNAGNRSELTDAALGDVGRNYDLLDLFVSADYTIGGDVGVNIRAGKQVINWGESTFIQNGLNAFNPIDVAAIRKPGSEIKEALVPVNAIFASVSLPINVSLSGWYALDWEPFEIDPSGTPFSTADSIALGSGVGGNQMYSFVTASPFGSNRRNCNAAAGSGTRTVQTNGLLNNPWGTGGTSTTPTSALGNNLLECTDSGFVADTVRLPNGQHELIRLGQLNGSGGQVNLSGDGVRPGGTGILARGQDYQAPDDDQFGIKMSLFAEELNGTEFGFYYQNYHSRLPLVQIETNGDNNGYLSFNLNSRNTEIATGLTSRALNNLGCGLTSAAMVGTIGSPFSLADIDPVTPGVQVAANLTMAGAIGTLGNPATAGTAANQMANRPVFDPGNVLPTAAAALAAQTGGLFTLNPTNGFKNQLAVAQLNCALTYYQSGFVNPLGAVGAPGTTVQTFDGAEFLVAAAPAQVSVVYPEDIEVFGFSFNTTVASWGVQGEATYRPSAPFQVDTDSLTIAGLTNGCVFNMIYGAAGPIVNQLATPDGSGVKPFCGSNNGFTNGVIRNEMFTAQVGTTAQFTGSDWFIQSLGADIGTLVTEVGMVYVPGVEDSWLDQYAARPTTGALAGVTYKDMVTQYQNTGCNGTDLPGAGILALDIKSSAQCRPTDFSAGLVALFTWQYNNFLDTGFAVSPRIVYSYDFEGTTAAPYSNYIEDRQAINLGVDGTLNNNLRVGVSYSNFFGGHINNKSSDRDFAAISASYSF